MMNIRSSVCRTFPIKKARFAEQYRQSVSEGSDVRMLKFELIYDIAGIGRNKAEEDDDDDTGDITHGGESVRQGKYTKAHRLGDHHCRSRQ